MIGTPSLPNVAILPFALVVCGLVQAQSTSPPPIDPAISQIAARIGNAREKTHVAKVIFGDLEGPSGEPHPAGTRLLDPLALAGRKDFPGLAAIVRPA